MSTDLMIPLMYRVLGYVGFLVWGVLLFLIICWKSNFKNIKNVRDDADKKRKFEKIVKVLNYLLYFQIVLLIISSLDVLLMAIEIFNPARLPYKATIIASVDIPGYFLVLFSRFMFRNALNHSAN